MQYRRSIWSLIAILCIAANCVADVAPDPGLKRIYLSLVLKPQGDISDYRFFMESGMELSEVKLSADEAVTIDPKGGGARYRSAIIYAVPEKELASVGAAPIKSELDALETALRENRVPGAVKLLEHGFSVDVPEKEADSYPNPVYQIRRDAQAGIVAEKLDDAGDAFHDPPSKTETTNAPSAADRGSMIVTASVLAFAVVLVGLRLLRRKTN